MKTVMDNEENQSFEFFKRILYSFQVLIVGIAIPVLFFLGISTREDQKKDKETEMSVSPQNLDFSAKSTFVLPSIIEI